MIGPSSESLAVSQELSPLDTLPLPDEHSSRSSRSQRGAWRHVARLLPKNGGTLKTASAFLDASNGNHWMGTGSHFETRSESVLAKGRLLGRLVHPMGKCLEVFFGFQQASRKPFHRPNLRFATPTPTVAIAPRWRLPLAGRRRTPPERRRRKRRRKRGGVVLRKF